MIDNNATTLLPSYLVFIPAMKDGFLPGENIPFSADGQRDDLRFGPPERKDAQSQTQEQSAKVHFAELNSFRFLIVGKKVEKKSGDTLELSCGSWTALGTE